MTYPELAHAHMLLKLENHRLRDIIEQCNTFHGTVLAHLVELGLIAATYAPREKHERIAELLRVVPREG